MDFGIAVLFLRRSLRLPGISLPRRAWGIYIDPIGTAPLTPDGFSRSAGGRHALGRGILPSLTYSRVNVLLRHFWGR
jgi:hypothetical protein